METLSPIDALYLTGSIEAGSSILIAKQLVKRPIRNGIGIYDSYTVCFKISRDSNPQLLKPLTQKPFKQFFPNPDSDYLQVAGSSALALLETTLPYMRLLKPLAKLAIDFEYAKKESAGSTLKQSLCEENYQTFRQRKASLAEFNTGTEKLEHPYLAGLWDQDRIYIETTENSLLCQIRFRNSSFLNLLQSQLGGHLYPKDEPKFWRAPTKEALNFFAAILPFSRRPHNELARFFPNS